MASAATCSNPCVASLQPFGAEHSNQGYVCSSVPVVENRFSITLVPGLATAPPPPTDLIELAFARTALAELHAARRRRRAAERLDRAAPAGLLHPRRRHGHLSRPRPGPGRRVQPAARRAGGRRRVRRGGGRPRRAPAASAATPPSRCCSSPPWPRAPCWRATCSPPAWAWTRCCSEACSGSRAATSRRRPWSRRSPSPARCWWARRGPPPASTARPRARSGLPIRRADLLLLGLVAATVVAALPAVGALLVTSLLVVPAAVARLLSERLRPMLALAVALALVQGVLGLYLALWLDVPARPRGRGGRALCSSASRRRCDERLRGPRRGARRRLRHRPERARGRGLRARARHVAGRARPQRRREDHPVPGAGRRPAGPQRKRGGGRPPRAASPGRPPPARLPGERAGRGADGDARQWPLVAAAPARRARGRRGGPRAGGAGGKRPRALRDALRRPAPARAAGPGAGARRCGACSSTSR